MLRPVKFAEIQGNNLTLKADILAAAFFMLSRYEEIDSPHLDKHGRYQYSASVTSRYGLIDLPIVDIYALLLKVWLEALTGEQITPPHRFQFHFSHDVDYMFLSHPFHKWLDVIARDLAKGRLDFFRQDFPSLFTDYTEDAYYRDLRRLVEMAQANGSHDVFYLLTSREPFARDGYSLKDRRVRTAIDLLKSSGMQIGLHASYRSYDKAELYAIEKQRLEESTGITCRGSRQHYLRIRTPYTWNQMKAAGLEYDESYCFSEHEGFRCGTCYPYTVFDVQQDRELDFSELPLIVMETSLRVYRKLSAAQGFREHHEVGPHLPKSERHLHHAVAQHLFGSRMARLGPAAAGLRQDPDGNGAPIIYKGNFENTLWLTSSFQITPASRSSPASNRSPFTEIPAIWRGI